MLTFHRCGTEVLSSILNTKGTCNPSDGPASHVKTHPTVRSSTGAQSPQHMPRRHIAWPAIKTVITVQTHVTINHHTYARNRCFVSTINHIRSNGSHICPKQMFQSQIRSIRAVEVPTLHRNTVDVLYPPTPPLIKSFRYRRIRSLILNHLNASIVGERGEEELSSYMCIAQYMHKE
jgi:hypothetical protein